MVDRRDVSSVASDRLAAFRIGRFELKTSRKLGSSVNPLRQVSHVGVLELETAGGVRGLGVFEASPFPSELPPRDELVRSFASLVAPTLVDVHPQTFLHRLSPRPRGGHLRRLIFTQAVDQAIWDIAAKQLGLPLWYLLGGDKGSVPVYASAHDYSHSNDEIVELVTQFRERGIHAIKFKIGYKDETWELARLTTIWQALGPDGKLLIDANEAWSPKEAVRRMHRFHDAGIDIYWLEDPCLKDDFKGIAEVCRAVPFSRINAGENLDLTGKRLLLEHRAVDVLNLHGWYSETVQAAQMAVEYGIPVTIGNVLLDLSAPLAAALPSHTMMEYSMTGEDVIVEKPFQLDKKGILHLHDVPGHGLSLNRAAREDLSEALQLGGRG
jgi:L-alanine-DL-glutamate epimerase-like enolase superfamily enzyme